MDRISFVFPGNPKISLINGFITVLILAGGAIGFIFIGNIKAFSVGLIMLILLFYLLTKFIHKVYFDSEGIEVRYFVGKSLKIQYKDVKQFYGSNDGLLPAPIFVMKYKTTKRSGKITFACSEEELTVLIDTFFNGFKINRHDQPSYRK